MFFANFQLDDSPNYANDKMVEHFSVVIFTFFICNRTRKMLQVENVVEWANDGIPHM